MCLQASYPRNRPTKGKLGKMLRLQINPFCAIPLIALIAGVAPAPSGGDRQSVAVTYLDCPDNLGRSTQIRLTALDGHGRIALAQSWENNPTGINRIAVSLSPGYYDVVIASGNCSDEILVDVLQGHNRNVVAMGHRGAAMHTYRATLSGTLPFAATHVGIVYLERKALQYEQRNSAGLLEIPAAINGTAYYAVWLPSGKATIRLYNEGLHRWLDIGAININPPQTAAHIVFDITNKAISSKLLELSKQRPTCVPGKARGIVICTPPT